MSKVAKPTGLKAIAEEVNVSVSLVSKVLNNRLGNSRVAPQTIVAIRAAARSLGYRKNHAAAALVAGRQNVIGGFVHNLGCPTSGLTDRLIRGMAAGAARHGRRLMLRFFESAEEFLHYTSEVSTSLLDGLIVAGVRHEELTQRLSEVEAAGVPVVTIHEHHHVPAVHTFPNVYVDQRDVCDMATEHLIQQGCRRIAHLKVVALRAEGYIRALSRNNLPVDPGLVYSASGFLHEHGGDAIRHFESNGIEFDGVVAQSDELAVGAINALQAAGRCVPKGVKVIGVDNAPFCTVLPTTISSVSTEFHTQGQCAIDLLVHRIEGRPISSMRIDPVLLPRLSSAAGSPEERVTIAATTRQGAEEVTS